MWQSRRCISSFLLLLLVVAVQGRSLLKNEAWLSSASTEPETQIEAVRGLLQRLFPTHMHQFSLSLIPSENGLDVFEVETVKSQLQLRGSSGVALASALNWYLKYKCHVQITWQDAQLQLPSILPPVVPTYRQETPFSYRYYYNVCTFGYSSAFWSWERWEKDIDWMALNGINFPLAFVGQEYVWMQTFAALGLNTTEISDEWFSGNLNNWAGPISSRYITATVELQRRILLRQRQFGMTPVLPGFAGHVPPMLQKYFPNATVTKLIWSKEFGYTYLLSAEDPLFYKIGNQYIKMQAQIFGTDHFYNADPFNEMLPTSNSPTYLSAVSKAIYAGMTQADPQAIWVLQGWFLLHAGFWWQPPQVKAFLDAVPDDRLIVLDLWAEIDPYWKNHDNFYGKKFIWCMLHNFGGRSGLYATFDRVNHGVIDSLTHAPNMIGIGLTPEAIETNPIIYDFMMEFTWNKNLVDLDAWIANWSHRRYGVDDSAAVHYWSILKNDILNCPTNQMGPTAPAYIARPNVTIPEVIGCCAPTHTYYQKGPLVEAWKSLLSISASLGSLETYKNDLIEITRQVLGDISIVYITDVITAYNNSDHLAFTQGQTKFLELLLDLDTILGSQPGYLLGVWAQDASKWGSTAAEVDLMIHNALLQVTLWGPATWENNLHEYAYKIWSGLTVPYYGHRWKLFFDFLEASIEKPYSFNPSEFHAQMFKFEWEFTENVEHLPPTSPNGYNTVELSHKLFKKWISPQILERLTEQ